MLRRGEVRAVEESFAKEEDARRGRKKDVQAELKAQVGSKTLWSSPVSKFNHETSQSPSSISLALIG